jgi:hypothetical protein
MIMTLTVVLVSLSIWLAVWLALYFMCFLWWRVTNDTRWLRKVDDSALGIVRRWWFGTVPLPKAKTIQQKRLPKDRK